MTLEFTIVHLSPLVNSYKGRDYFSAFVFYSANLKEITEITENQYADTRGLMYPEALRKRSTRISVLSVFSVCQTKYSVRAVSAWSLPSAPACGDLRFVFVFFNMNAHE